MRRLDQRSESTWMDQCPISASQFADLRWRFGVKLARDRQTVEVLHDSELFCEIRNIVRSGLQHREDDASEKSIPAQRTWIKSSQ